MYRIWMVVLCLGGLILAACAGVDRPIPGAYPEPQSPDSPVVSEPGANPDKAYPAPWAPKPGDEALARGEAFVDKMDILTLESFPPQFMLSLAGSLPTPCHDLRVKVDERVGPSAISSVEGLYAQNAKDLCHYYDRIGRGELATTRGLDLSPRERTIGGAIRDLLCRGEADVAAALSRMSPVEANAVCRKLDALDADGVIEWRGDLVKIAPEARPLARIVGMALDPYEARTATADQPAFARAI